MFTPSATLALFGTIPSALCRADYAEAEHCAVAVQRLLGTSGLQGQLHRALQDLRVHLFQLPAPSAFDGFVGDEQFEYEAQELLADAQQILKWLDAESCEAD